MRRGAVRSTTGAGSRTAAGGPDEEQDGGLAQCPFYGAGKVGKSTLFDYSRKLAYVGFSRPRTLLCVAMKSETYQKSKGVFDKDWEIIDLRK